MYISIHQTFRANGETTCPRPVILPTAVRAKCVRIIPTLWNQHIHLRIDLIGCSDNGTLCTSITLQPFCVSSIQVNVTQTEAGKK